MSGTVYGIDLGTTYSAIARIDDLEQATIIKNMAGEDTTPSVVLFEPDGTAVVGSEAKSSLVSDPDEGCSLIKRHMGTSHPLEFAGTMYTPESISAIILKELVNAANTEAGQEISKAVITVPAYFGLKEKEATRQAGAMAGLDVVGIIAEPIAAALSLGVRGEKRETILVYDLGGGTFDTTVMIVEPGNVEVVAVDGNRTLGGADWDTALANVVIEKFVQQAGIPDDPSDDAEFMIELLVDIEEKKKSLTKRSEISIRCRFEGYDEKIAVTRQEFEAATAHLIAQTVEITERTIATAQEKSPGLAVDKLLLVGGSSRMPMVPEALIAKGFNPINTNFDLAVAQGAAIYGQAIEDGAAPISGVTNTGEEGCAPAPTNTQPKFYLGPGVSTLTISNVLSRGIGVEFVDGSGRDYVGFLAHANDPLPIVDLVQEAGTAVDNQQTVSIKLYEQGGEVESDALANNTLLAEKPISGLPPLPRGSAIELILNVTNEGIATLSAREPVSGQALKVEAKIAELNDAQVAEGTAAVTGLTTRS